MTDAPTPLDLDAIRAMLGDRLAVTTRSVALDLLAEVERLRAEVRLATTSAHPASLALGAQLADRAAPAWDEEAVRDELVVAVREAHRAADTCSGPWADEAMTDAVLAVVRDHLPVKPDRETVARAISPDSWLDVDYGPAPSGTGEREWDLIKARATGSARAASLAASSRALDLLPGRSEAVVKAEALNEAADWLADMDDGRDTGQHRAGRDIIARLRDRADRLAAEGGADRG